MKDISLSWCSNSILKSFEIGRNRTNLWIFHTHEFTLNSWIICKIWKSRFIHRLTWRSVFKNYVLSNQFQKFVKVQIWRNLKQTCSSVFYKSWHSIEGGFNLISSWYNFHRQHIWSACMLAFGQSSLYFQQISMTGSTSLLHGISICARQLSKPRMATISCGLVIIFKSSAFYFSNWIDGYCSAHFLERCDTEFKFVSFDATHSLIYSLFYARYVSLAIAVYTVIAFSCRMRFRSCKNLAIVVFE